MVAWALVFEFAIGVFAAVIGLLVSENPLVYLLPGANPARTILIGLVATAPPLLLFLWFLRSRWKPLRRTRGLLRRIIRPLLRAMTPARAGAISIAAGAGEEFLFRGVMQVALTPAIGPIPALLIASTAFGAAHWITPTYAAYATVFGLYLGGLFIMTGTLIVPIIVHALYDWVALVLLSQVDTPESYQ